MKLIKSEYYYYGLLGVLFIVFILMQDVGYRIWGSQVDTWEMRSTSSAHPSYYYIHSGAGHRPTHK